MNAVLKTKKVNLGGLADDLYAKNEEISALNAKLKALEDEKKGLEEQILTGLRDAGTDIARGNIATISISETVRASITDFAAFEKFVLSKKALHLFERRISATAYREQLDLLKGKPVPGLSPYTQIRINCRKVA